MCAVHRSHPESCAPSTVPIQAAGGGSEAQAEAGGPDPWADLPPNFGKSADSPDWFTYVLWRLTLARDQRPQRETLFKKESHAAPSTPRVAPLQTGLRCSRCQGRRAHAALETNSVSC